MPPRKRTDDTAPAAEQDVAPKSRKHASDVPSNADAAALLGVYESEVDHVEDTAEGVVITTSDGQRYRLDADAPQGWVWLHEAPAVPQILAGE